MVISQMTQKHFKAIGNIIKKNTAKEENQFDDLSIYGNDLIYDLCEYFKKENTKFDSDKFLKSCEVEE